MERISLQDTTMDVVVKMCDGNPGAMNVLMELIKANQLDAILSLDSHGIYGTDIYVLWSDICDRDINKARAVLRASQMGLIDSAIVTDACSRQDYSGKEMIPVDELYANVIEKWPDFNNEGIS